MPIVEAFFMKKKRRFRFPLWLKTLLVLVLSVSLVSVVAIVFSSNTVRTITRNIYVEQATQKADSLGIYLNLDDVKVIKDKVQTIYKSIPEEEKVANEEWDSPEWTAYLEHYSAIVETPEYARLLKQLETFHAKNDARFTYIAYADLEDQRLVYLVDDAEPEERCLPGSFDAFTEQDMTIYDHIETGFEPEVTNFEEYGYLVSVGRPIFDENHNLVAFSLVDLSMDKIVAEETRNTWILAAILLSLGVFAVLAGYLLVLFMIIKPVRKLTKVANEYIEGGNESLDKFAQVNVKTSDEIEDLSNSMKKMEEDINRYIEDLLSTTTKLEGAEKQADEFKHLADKDALTGLNNKRSYFEIEERLNDEIKHDMARFAITMIDLNDLKVTNDTLGHEKGDALIIALSKIIRRVFENSNLFRIGGDEFVVISEGRDYDNIKELEKMFASSIKKTVEKIGSEELPVSAAIGVAIFDKDNDNNVEDTFKRADAKMYQNKKEMKAKR